MEWFDTDIHSSLLGSGVLGSAVGIWLNASEGLWMSNTPPVSGSWRTREEGKTAIISALIQYHERILAELNRLETEAAKERAEVATK